MEKKQANLNNMDVVGTNLAPVSDIAGVYDKANKNLLNQLYQYGVDLTNLTEKVDTERAILRLRNKNLQRRVEFKEKWGNPANINYADEEWDKKRTEAFNSLQEAEKNDLKLAGLNNVFVEKEEAQNNEYYMQERLNYQLDRGQWKRKTDITTAGLNIQNYLYLALDEETTPAQSESYIDSVNKSIDMLKGYGISEEEINANVLKILNERHKEGVIRATQQEMKGANTSNWGLKQQRIGAKVNFETQRGLATAGKINTLKNSTYNDIYKLTSHDNIKFVDMAIEQKDENLQYRAMREQEAEEKAREREAEKQIRAIEKEQRVIDKQLENTEKEIKNYNTFLENYKTASDRRDVEKLLYLNANYEGKEVLTSFDISDKILGTDFIDTAGRVIYGTKENPKITSLEKISEGKEYETIDILNPTQLSEVNSVMTELNKAGAGNIEKKQFLQKYITDNLNIDGYELSQEQIQAKVEGATLTIANQLGIDPKLFRGDIATKETVSNNVNNLDKNKYFNENDINLLVPLINGQETKKNFFGSDQSEVYRNIRSKFIQVNGGTSSNSLDRHVAKFIYSIINKDDEVLKGSYNDNKKDKIDYITDLANEDNVLNGVDEEELNKMVKAYWDLHIRGIKYRKAPIMKPTIKFKENVEQEQGNAEQNDKKGNFLSIGAFENNEN